MLSAAWGLVPKENGKHRIGKMENSKFFRPKAGKLKRGNLRFPGDQTEVDRLPSLCLSSQQTHFSMLLYNVFFSANHTFKSFKCVHWSFNCALYSYFSSTGILLLLSFGVCLVFTNKAPLRQTSSRNNAGTERNAYVWTGLVHTWSAQFRKIGWQLIGQSPQNKWKIKHGKSTSSPSKKMSERHPQTRWSFSTETWEFAFDELCIIADTSIGSKTIQQTRPLHFIAERADFGSQTVHKTRSLGFGLGFFFRSIAIARTMGTVGTVGTVELVKHRQNVPFPSGKDQQSQKHGQGLGYAKANILRHPNPKH